MGRKNKKVSFAVLSDGDNGQLKVWYVGPDKRKARQEAQGLLAKARVADLVVWRVTQSIKLTRDDLTSSLDRGAF